MDKQYKLTDRVSKDSIKSPIFKKWVKRILCIACILSLALQFTLCCFPMYTSAAETDSIIGTWVFNDTLEDFVFAVDMQFKVGDREFIRMYTPNRLISGVTKRVLDYTISIDGDQSSGFAPYDFSTDSWGSGYAEFKIIEILSEPVAVSGWSATISEFKSWLRANASKVGGESYDFTGETRIFNDELTLFNTSDATWTYAANFDFEVLGVGSADYITLQRTEQNNYTMSYSFDFEGSGGLTMIYRDSPPFNDDEAEWLGGKVNRKVITFLSNPDDPDFQQWLLDNTTLFDNVNDAYLLGQQSGYNNGYEEGFANSLIGDTLSGPINALSQITLIEIQGTAITLGGVVMTAIALCLVLAFLKLYAGG